MNEEKPFASGLFRTVEQLELSEMARIAGGGTFVVSSYLREDGFLFTFNLPFMERLRREGILDRYVEILSKKFEEVLNDAKKKSK